MGGREGLRVAALQLSSQKDKNENIEKALGLIKSAKTQGARLVVLPELFNCCSTLEDIVKKAESVPGPTINLLARKARQNKIYILCGSIMERARKGRAFNTSVLLGPRGQILGIYRKIHLFDIDIPKGIRFKESESILPGSELTTARVDGYMVGLSICYDLRFPELFRALRLRGAEIILLPSAFTTFTGKDHWEVLLRARAIENQVYIVAPNQLGTHPNRITTLGRSMIVDPWGTVLTQAPDKETLVVADLDLNLLREVRRRLPITEANINYCGLERREAR